VTDAKWLEIGYKEQTADGRWRDSIEKRSGAKKCCK
jgi:hypothetical protein